MTFLPRTSPPRARCQWNPLLLCALLPCAFPPIAPGYPAPLPHQAASQPSAPDPASDLLRQGESLAAQGNVAGALAAYQAALRLAPASAAAYLQIGLLQGKTGDFESAARAFQQAIHLQPNLPEAHYNLGLALIAKAKQVPAWKEAGLEFDAALALRPAYPEALNLSGVCLLESGDSAQAVARFRSALKIQPANAELHFNLGRALEAAGHPDEALAAYAEARKARNPYPEADLKMGSLLLDRKDYPAAEAHLRLALQANPDNQEAHYKLAQVLRRTGSAEAAAIELRQSAALTQRESDTVMAAHLSNESLDRAKSGDAVGALELARKSLWLDPSSAIANYNLGLLLADAGNFEASALELRKAISLAPLRAAFYVSLAEVERQRAHLPAARANLAQALRLHPGDSQAQKLLAELGSTPELTQAPPGPAGSGSELNQFPDTADGHISFASLLSRQGDLLGAVGELLRACALDPARRDTHMQLGVLRAQLNQTDQAELEFRKALLQSPSDAAAHVALASLLFSMQKYPEAAAELRQALQIQPGNPEAARLLAKLPVHP